MTDHDASRSPPAPRRRPNEARHRPPLRGARAFSILELTISLAIVAVLSAIAVPRYLSSMDQYHLEAAARRVVSDVALTRSDAMATGSPRAVVFGGSPNAYLLQGVADPDRGTVSTLVHLDGAPYVVNIASAVFDDPLDVSDGLNTVIFDGYGQPDSGGSVKLTRGARSITVVLDGKSGEAQVP